MNKNNMKENQKTITRFAPSPTGFMHVGGVRTALYAYFWAKKNNGNFILRIEDTDKEREVEGSIEHIIKSLKWLGIEWDEGPDISGPNTPYIQSERLDSYKKYANILIEKGLAYTDPYTKEELEEFRQKAENEKRAFLYRDNRPENPPKWNGSTPLRFKVPEIKSYEWEDLVRGKLKAGPEALDDFILIKSDGYPTYNFAHIIDDLEMGVTHIMRADEFISSTPKFLSLYDALEITPPKFVTLPPIMGPDGKKKLGKRDGAKDVLEYKKEGYLPEAMINFLAFIGWNPGDEREILSKQELIEVFDIKGIHISGGKFNEEKLNWINREYLKKMDFESQCNYILDFIPETIKSLSSFNKDLAKKITPIIMDRICCGKDIYNMFESKELDYFFQEPNYDLNNLFFKSSKIETSNKYQILASYLENVKNLLENINNNEFTKDNIKNSIWEYAEQVGRGDILWPLRYSLSGLDKSPDPFLLSEILGKEITLKRILFAINKLRE
jgi:glutamyl-tRNA synthetase